MTLGVKIVVFVFRVVKRLRDLGRFFAISLSVALGIVAFLSVDIIMDNAGIF